MKRGAEKQQARQLQAPAAIQQNSFECTLFFPCWDLACQSEHFQLYLDGMFIHLERVLCVIASVGKLEMDGFKSILLSPVFVCVYCV